MSTKRPPKAIWPLVIWDAALKLAAIWRAVRLRNYRMIPVLAVTSSAGILPMGYLWRTRKTNGGMAAGHASEGEA